MLGFDVYVTAERDGREVLLARWAIPTRNSWMDHLERTGAAVLISSNGGYPDVFRAAAAAIVPTLAFTEAATLPEALGAKQHPRLWVNADALCACPLNGCLTITLWDQS